MPHSDSILGLKRLTIAIKAGLPGYNYSTRIRWDWRGGLIFPTNAYGNPVFKSKTALTYAG